MGPPLAQQIPSSWCHPRAVSAPRPPSWSGLATVPLGVLPLQLFIPAPLSAQEAVPRRVLLPGLFPRHRRVRSSREARHLIRTLRLRLAKVGEELLGAGELAEEEDDPVNRETYQAVPGRPSSQNYAPSA